MLEAKDRPIRTPDKMAPQLNERYLEAMENTKDVDKEKLAETETPIELMAALSNKPHTFGSFVFTEEQMASVRIPKTPDKNKIPGPGSEGDFPYGYKPSYATPQSPDNGPGGNSGMSQPGTQADYANGQNPASPYSPALRQGQGFPPTNDNWSPKSPGNDQNSIQSALRSGPMSPGGAAGNTGREPWPGYWQGKLPPGMKGPPPPPPGHEHRGHPVTHAPLEFGGGMGEGWGGGMGGDMGGGMEGGMYGGWGGGMREGMREGMAGGMRGGTRGGMGRGVGLGGAAVGEMGGDMGAGAGYYSPYYGDRRSFDNVSISNIPQISRVSTKTNDKNTIKQD